MGVIVNTYAIIDVAQFSSGIVRFVRYQTNPQGNIVYHGFAVDGTTRFVHEVAGQMNANSLAYTRNQNIYNDVVNGTFKRDTVDGWPTNPFGSNASIPKVISLSATNTANCNQIAYFQFENLVTKTGRPWRNVRDGGRSKVFKKPGNYQVRANYALGEYTDVPGFVYSVGRWITDVNIWINPNPSGDPYIFDFMPLGEDRTIGRGYHYYDRHSRYYNPAFWAVTIA